MHMTYVVAYVKRNRLIIHFVFNATFTTRTKTDSFCEMKVQQFLCVFLVSLVTGEAADTLLRSRERYLSENSTVSKSSSATASTGSNVTYANRSDDDKDDDDGGNSSNKTDSNSTDDNDDTQSSNNASNPFVLVHKKEVSMTEKDDDDSSLFTPPEEVEPHFWKEAVAGIFLAVALVLCCLTARKTCCKPKGYREIPSTTLVV